MGRFVPIQRGMAPLSELARRTQAVISRTRTSSSTLPGKDKAIAWLEKADKRLGHRTEARPLEITHLDLGVACNGADGQAMALRNVPVLDDVATIHLYQPFILWVGVKGVATVDDKVERPAPFVVGQVAIGVGGAHFGQHLLGCKSPTQPDRDEVLHEHVKRLGERGTALDVPLDQGAAHGGGFDQFEGMGGHAGHA